MNDIQLSYIDFSGNHVGQFLQGQLTADINALIEGKPQITAHCNAKGRVISLLDIVQQDGNYRLYMPSNMLDIAEKHLKKYAQFSRISLHCYTSVIDDATFNAWRLQRIQQNMPSLFPHTSEVFLPHHINLPELNGVSFSKGCYVGQEIIARMQHLGNIKQHMHYYQLHSQQTLSPGDALFADQNEKQEVAKIIDVITNDRISHATVSIKDHAQTKPRLFKQGEVIERTV